MYSYGQLTIKKTLSGGEFLNQLKEKFKLENDMIQTLQTNIEIYNSKKEILDSLKELITANKKEILNKKMPSSGKIEMLHNTLLNFIQNNLQRIVILGVCAGAPLLVYKNREKILDILQYFLNEDMTVVQLLQDGYRIAADCVKTNLLETQLMHKYLT
jgi:hypothetical protein